MEKYLAGVELISRHGNRRILVLGQERVGFVICQVFVTHKDGSTEEHMKEYPRNTLSVLHTEDGYNLRNGDKEEAGRYLTSWHHRRMHLFIQEGIKELDILRFGSPSLREKHIDKLRKTHKVRVVGNNDSHDHNELYIVIKKRTHLFRDFISYIKTYFAGKPE